MGLPERRAAANFKDTKFADFEKQIDEAAGFKVPLEIKWDTLVGDGYTSQYDEAASNIFFIPLIGAIKAVAFDQMGKDALKAGLKKVVITNETENHSYQGFKFENGVLLIDHMFTNVSYVEDRTKGIQKLLEKAL